ncbi:Dna polymerase epsilon subunit B protein [Cardiosporidium cionae]|uniref:DNA polymerase alpha subunit B n=1 Tax=Cardiosporidium cionae TaxID=476202 RepID=A0ABQ7J9J4_9APIC|nr:Dna polymerase epsilon subunit B protein [Cardiosporidium cionae]|eukprot:KAF8820670.1 Dna polymerase epsilon subunit B protein [Cardiosporidium cionae]
MSRKSAGLEKFEKIESIVSKEPINTLKTIVEKYLQEDESLKTLVKSTLPSFLWLETYLDPPILLLSPPSPSQELHTLPSCKPEHLNVKIISRGFDSFYSQKGWMQSTAEDISMQLSNHLVAFSQAMETSYQGKFHLQSEDEEDLSIVSVGSVNQFPVVIFGRLTSEIDGIFTESSILLEGNEECHGNTVLLCDLKQLKSPFCLFPGQIVAAIGISEEIGNSYNFYVKKLYNGLPVPPPTISLENIYSKIQSLPSHYIDIFCANANLFISPLKQILDAESSPFYKEIRKKSPHFLILFGPLVPLEQSFDENLNALPDLRALYTSYIHNLHLVAKQLPKTRILLLPHCEDVLHPYPLPQPAYSKFIISDNIPMPSNIHYMENPGYFKVNDLHIGLTSCDPLDALLHQSLCNPPAEALNLLCQELLTQRSFFPFIPSNFPVEYGLLKEMAFNEEDFPNIFLFSSSAGDSPFALEVNSHIFINCFLPSSSKESSIGSASNCMTRLRITSLPIEENSKSESFSKECLLNLPSRIYVECYTQKNTKEETTVY